MVGRRQVGAALFTALLLSWGPAWAVNEGKVGFGLAGPFQCDLCHGNDATGQYWPDGSGGRPAYADDQAGAHDNHIAAISQYKWGEGIPVLLTDTVNGTADAKQRAVCVFCHPDPGGSGHSTNDGTRDPTGRVTVYLDADDTSGALDVFRKYTGSGADGVDRSGVNGDQAYLYGAAGEGTCRNLVCHNQADTPFWNAPPDWTLTLTGKCSNTTCHASATYTVAHAKHVGSTQKNYACDECHADHGTDLRHQNGLVDLEWTTPGSLEATAPSELPRRGDAFYDKDGDTVATPADLQFAYKDGNYARICYQVYCHGGDNDVAATVPWGGTDPTPQWNQPSTATCGSCHERNTPTTGNHEAHVSAPYGPTFGAGICGGCHTGSAASDQTHASGTADFANLDTSVTPVSRLGLTAPAGPPDATSTDRCNNCHSTAVAVGQTDNGTVLAKTNWSDGAYQLPCLSCHNAADPASEHPDGTGVLAPGKDPLWASRGHGLSSTSQYPWSTARDGANAACDDCHDAAAAHISGALADTDRLATPGNALCNGCHDGAGGGSAVSQVSTHSNTSTTMTTTYSAQRAAFQLNCAECHDVHGTANIFMINGPNADGPLVAPRQYNGSADTTTLLFNGTVAFTDDSVGTSATAGVGYAQAGSGNATKICQTCHTQTGHYQYNSDDGHLTTDCMPCHKHDFDGDFAANSQDGFMPAGCNGCHGFPPVNPADVPAVAASLGLPATVDTCAELALESTDFVCENYPDGGGIHFRHVTALKGKLADSKDPAEICGPCHGDGAGTTNHNASSQGPGTWLISARASVNIRVRATGNSWDGMPSDPRSATYGGSAVNVTGTSPPGNAVDASDSRCGGVDCHGNPDPSDADEVLSWNLNVADDPGDPEDALNKSRTCEGCHDETPSQWRVYNVGGSAVYTGNAPNAAVSYYRTLSGYSRGGHGDAEIQNEDPGVDSDPGHVTPIDCTGCHSDTAAHFPEAAGNVSRLAIVTVEDTSHSSSGLCNSCHSGTSYTGTGDNHHPSLRGTSSNPTRDVVVTTASQEVRTAVDATTDWVDGAGGPCASPDDFCEQTAYGAANYNADPDRFINWWAGRYGDGSQTPPPKPVFFGESQSASPKAVLPLLQFVGNQSGLNNAVMCVTCHNPHGTDLYVYDIGGVGGAIPDNNMLRLRDEDNTLCNACH